MEAAPRFERVALKLNRKPHQDCAPCGTFRVNLNAMRSRVSAMHHKKAENFIDLEVRTAFSIPD